MVWPICSSRHGQSPTLRPIGQEGSADDSCVPPSSTLRPFHEKATRGGSNQHPALKLIWPKLPSYVKCHTIGVGAYIALPEGSLQSP
jgi:hypothetical protein